MIASLIIGIFQLAFGAKICYNYNGESIFFKILVHLK